MDCPVCKNATTTLEARDVEVDYCNDCGGIWLSSAMLRAGRTSFGGGKFFYFFVIKG